MSITMEYCKQKSKRRVCGASLLIVLVCLGGFTGICLGTYGKCKGALNMV